MQDVNIIVRKYKLVGTGRNICVSKKYISNKRKVDRTNQLQV